MPLLQTGTYQHCSGSALLGGSYNPAVSPEGQRGPAACPSLLIRMEAKTVILNFCLLPLTGQGALAVLLFVADQPRSKRPHILNGREMKTADQSKWQGPPICQSVGGGGSGTGKTARLKELPRNAFLLQFQ